jgi:hypothetical protein
MTSLTTFFLSIWILKKMYKNWDRILIKDGEDGDN